MLPSGARGRSCPIDRRQTTCRPASNARPQATPRSAANGSASAVRRDAVDGALEAARHVQRTVRTERHRRRVDDAGRERLARAVRRTRKIDTGTCCPRDTAVGDVQAALAIEDRVVHLVQAGGERRRDVDECGAGRPRRRLDRRAAAVERPARHHDSRCGRGEANTARASSPPTTTSGSRRPTGQVAASRQATRRPPFD